MMVHPNNIMYQGHQVKFKKGKWLFFNLDINLSFFYVWAIDKGTVNLAQGYVKVKVIWR